MQIKIVKNNIAQKIDVYQVETGATKRWIAEKLGMSSQRLHSLCNAENMMVDVALKFAIFLNCTVNELFEYHIMD